MKTSYPDWVLASKEHGEDVVEGTFHGTEVVNLLE